MSGGIYVALSGAVAQETNLETTATNLANASTSGYQRLRPVFREVLGRSTKGQLHYGAVAGTALDTSTGEVRTTKRELDVVLPKDSYLTVQTARGLRYTRAGSLSVSNDGILRAESGDPVVSDQGTPIKIPPGGGKSPSITPDAEVKVDDVTAGRLRVVTFPRSDMLVHEGKTLLSAPPGAGNPTPTTEPLRVGELESSNAGLVQSMTELMTATRSFEAFQRAIEAFREADRKIVGTVPGPT